MLRKFRSERLAKRHRRIFWTKFVLSLIFLSFLVWGFSYVTKLEKVNISNINIIGNKAISEKDILEIANRNLEGGYFKLFSKSNILIYPKSKIKKELLDFSLRIKELMITFKNFQTININIVERTPFALYCKDKDINLEILSPDEQIATSTEFSLVLEELSDEESEKIKEENLEVDSLNKESQIEECYFMDEEGFIYAQAMNFTDNVYFKYEQELSKINDLGILSPSGSKMLGKTYLEGARENQFEKVNLFIRFLKDINVDVYRLLVKENGDYELSFDNESLLIFDEKQDFDMLLENLQAVLIDLGDLEEREFEYIDLRFDNKVLYKFKEKEK